MMEKPENTHQNHIAMPDLDVDAAVLARLEQSAMASFGHLARRTNQTQMQKPKPRQMASAPLGWRNWATWAKMGPALGVAFAAVLAFGLVGYAQFSQTSGQHPIAGQQSQDGQNAQALEAAATGQQADAFASALAGDPTLIDTSTSQTAEIVDLLSEQ